MKDIDSKEDTEVGSEDLALSWRELSVGSVGHCQSAGNWIAVAYNPQALLEPWTGILDSNSFLPEKHPVNALTTIQFGGLFTHEPSHPLSVLSV
jgi:hypothetical protein